MTETRSDDISSVNQYYLQVQALTPVETTDSTSTAEEVNLFQTYRPMILGSVFIGSTILLVLSRNVWKAYGFTRTLGMLVMVFAVSAGLLSTNRSVDLRSNAGPNEVPKNVIVDQVTADSFILTWTTVANTEAVVKIANQQKPEVTLTFVSSSDNGNDHLVKVTNLDSSTAYSFQILSGGDWYSDPQAVVSTQ